MSASTIARTDAFTTLGTPLLSTTSAADALAAGGLANWNVRKAPAYAVDPVTGETIVMRDRNAVIFDQPGGGLGFLGDVGRFHTTIQNEEQIDIMNIFAEEAGATFETAGHAKGGKRVFVTMRFPGSYRIGGVDLVDNYVAGINAHDGASFVLMVTPLRFACMNMLNVALKEHSQLIRVRHTKGAPAKLREEALKLVDQTFVYLDEFREVADRLVDTTLTDSRFAQIVEKEFGAPEDASAAAVTRGMRRTEEMLDLFAHASTQDGIRNTAWAGFNALTEWSDHFASVRGEDDEAKLAARAERAILDPAFKDRALQLMLAEAV